MLEMKENLHNIKVEQYLNQGGLKISRLSEVQKIIL